MFMIKWTPFLGSPYNRTKGQPRVSLSKTKIFTISRTAWEALKCPAAVRFFYDAPNKRIGVAKCEPDETFAFRIHDRPKMSFRYVHGGAFCNHFGILPEQTISFNKIEIDAEGIMSLDLTTATPSTRGRRR